MKPASFNLKRASALLVFGIIALSLSSCQALGNPIISALGTYSHREFYSEGAFQDFTDYGKYYFISTSVGQSPYFRPLQASDLPVIHEHLDDFENWIEVFRSTDPSRKIVQNYDFDRQIIDTEDYIYLVSETHTWNDGHTSLVSYTLYFFDSQSLVLYYFHNNI